MLYKIVAFFQRYRAFWSVWINAGKNISLYLIDLLIKGKFNSHHRKQMHIKKDNNFPGIPALKNTIFALK